MRRYGSLLCSLVLLTPAPGVRAEDVRVDSDTVFQVYEVRSPGTAAFLARQRLVQTLAVSWSRVLVEPEEVDAPRPLPRLSASLRLRLDQDFGDDCLVSRDLCHAATRPGDPAFYQPLADDTEVDATEAWVEVRELPLDARLRAGRQLHFSSIGLLRLDGGSARVEPLPWLAADAYGGALVRSTSIAGSDAFVPQGDPRLELDVPPERVPWVDEPETTWVVGGTVEVGRSRWARVAAGFREMREEDGLVARRASLAAVSQPRDELRLETAAVWDVLSRRVVDAVAQIAAEPLSGVVVRARVERHVPTFDGGTIWSYFDLVPVDEGRLGVTWGVTERLELGGAGRLRRARFGGGDEHDVGVEGHLRTKVAGVRLQLAGFAWGGDLGPVAAVLLDASRPLAHRVRAEVRASVWHFDDPLRAGLYGTSIAEAGGVRFRLSDATTLSVALEHAHSRVVGHRFRGLVALSVEVWR